MFDFVYNKFVAPILLVLCVVLLIAFAVQTVRINGVTVFGWNWVAGLKLDAENAQKQVHDAVTKCDQATLNLKNAQDKATTEMADKLRTFEDQRDKAVAELEQTSDKLQEVLANAKPGDTRALGPVVQSYLNSVRLGQGSNSGSPSQPLH